jgi:hypothetical protein
MEILQLPRSRHCRRATVSQLNSLLQLTLRLAVISHQPFNLRFTDWLTDWLTSQIVPARTAQNTPFPIVVVQSLPSEHFCLPNRYSAAAFTYLRISQSLPATGLHVAIWIHFLTCLSRRVRLTTSPPTVSRLSRENVGASTSHNPMGLHGLLQG